MSTWPLGKMFASFHRAWSVASMVGQFEIMRPAGSGLAARGQIGRLDDRFLYLPQYRAIGEPI